MAGLAGEVAAQDWSGSGRVRGKVTGPDGKPIAGAKVYYRMVENPEAGPPPFITNKSGAFSFLGLKGGAWLVGVEADGFKPWSSPAPVEVYSDRRLRTGGQSSSSRSRPRWWRPSRATRRAGT